MTIKQYARRDLMALDAAGGYYCRHVDHMTRESLHSKSDIAAELGWRDMQIAALQQKLDAVLAENVVKSDVIERLIGQFSMAGYHAVQNSLNPAQSLLYDAMQAQNAPATDAILNAVRAEGAASVGSLIRACADEFPDSAEDVVEECAMIADNKASQLRAETDTTSSQYESLAGGK